MIISELQTWPEGAREQLDQLINMLVEETLAMTDEEVLAEMVEDGVDLEEAASQMRAEVVSVIAKHRLRNA